MQLPLRFGRFSVLFRGTQYECFYQPSRYKRLYVLLSSAGTRTSYPRFDRFSWRTELQGHCLYIEDPMYEQFPDLSVGWYYGNKQKSFLEGVCEITGAAAQELEIPFAEICLIGSSAGGYAALYSAAFLPGALALAHNPQIRLCKWGGKSTFEQITGNKVSGKDVLKRDDIRWIAENKQSRFFITVNMLSLIDFDQQIEPWLAELGESATYPMTYHGCVMFLFHRTPGPRAHHVFPRLGHALPLINALTVSRRLNSDTIDEFVRSYPSAEDLGRI